MDKKEQRKAEFVESMCQKVNDLSVVDVVGSVVDLVPKGRHYMGLCPFHPDNHLGSFIVTPDKNIWQCFAEGIGGSAVRFEMLYYHLTYLQAAFRLAREYNLITEQEYKEFGNKRYNHDTIEVIRNKIEEPKKVSFKRASDDTISLVYELIPKICNLSENHRDHLLRVRKLSVTKDFFTVPTRRMYLTGRILSASYDEIESEVEKDSSIPEKLKLNEIEKRWNKVEEELPYVPGFFYNKQYGKIDFVSYKGIGMLCRDANGKPVGIQIRRDTVKDGEQRYVWFSSTFAQKDGSGASSGSPGGFIPGTKKNASICITEGRFKAEKIAEKGNDCIYVSGVSTWKSVLPILKKIQKGRDKVYLMFDADMMGNVAVHQQLVAFENELSTKYHFQTRLIVWGIEDGKGFDDLVINKGDRYYQSLKVLSYQDFSKKYDQVLQKVCESFDAMTIRDIKGEDTELFNVRMQKQMEKAIGL